MPPTTAYRPKSYPTILSDMLRRLKKALGAATYSEVGGILLTMLETTSFSVAEVHIRIKTLLDLFSIWRCRGRDLDERARDFGSDQFDQMKRRKARQATAPLIVADSQLPATSLLALDVVSGATVFQVQPGDGALFPTGGSVILERGTARAETVVFTRVGDVFNVIPVPGGPTGLLYAHSAATLLTFTATKSYIAAPVVTGGLAILLAPGTGAAWPATGAVVIDRESALRELLPFTRAGDTLILGLPLANNHAAGASLYLSTAGVDRQVPVSTGVFARATTVNAQVNFRTTAAGTLLDGDLTTGLISAESEDVGADTNVGSNTLTNWLDRPFPTAVVYNPVAATRGRNEEEDDDYKDRLWSFILSLSRSTPLAIETSVQGLEDPETGLVVDFAQVVEPIAPGLSTLYINDGTPTFTLTFAKRSGREVLINDALTGDKFAKLNAAAPFIVRSQPAAQRTPRLYRSDFGGVATSVGVNYIEDTSLALAVNSQVGKYVKTIDGQFYIVTSNTAIRLNVNAAGATPALGSYAVFDFTFDPLVPGVQLTDPGIGYVFNEATGDIELVSPLAAHDSLVAADDGAPTVGAYTYSTGLGAYVQRVVNGDRTDKQLYPGIRACGTKVLVFAASVISPSFTVQVIPRPNFSVAELAPLVSQVVQSYVNSTLIGGEVILAQLIALIIAIPGVADAYILKPAANSRAGAGQLQRIVSANVQVN